MRWPGSNRPVRDRLLAAALALLCLGAALEIHPATEAVGAEAWSEIQSWVSCHPGLAVHMEPATDSQRPTCPACLLRLASAGAHLPAATAAWVALAAREAVAEAGFAPLSRTAFAPLSRGPPRA